LFGSIGLMAAHSWSVNSWRTQDRLRDACAGVKSDKGRHGVNAGLSRMDRRFGARPGANPTPLIGRDLDDQRLRGVHADGEQVGQSL
jgi:hypothetical protein